MKFGPRRKLPAAGDLTYLQAALTRFVFASEFFDSRLNALTFLFQNVGEQLCRNRFVRDKNERLDKSHDLGRCPCFLRCGSFEVHEIILPQRRKDAEPN